MVPTRSLNSARCRRERRVHDGLAKYEAVPKSVGEELQKKYGGAKRLGSEAKFRQKLSRFEGDHPYRVVAFFHFRPEGLASPEFAPLSSKHIRLS